MVLRAHWHDSPFFGRMPFFLSRFGVYCSEFIQSLSWAVFNSTNFIIAIIFISVNHLIFLSFSPRPQVNTLIYANWFIYGAFERVSPMPLTSPHDAFNDKRKCNSCWGKCLTADLSSPANRSSGRGVFMPEILNHSLMDFRMTKWHNFLESRRISIKQLSKQSGHSANEVECDRSGRWEILFEKAIAISSASKCFQVEIWLSVHSTNDSVRATRAFAFTPLHNREWKDWWRTMCTIDNDLSSALRWNEWWCVRCPVHCVLSVAARNAR